MNKKTGIIAAVAFVVILGGYFLFQGDDNDTTKSSTASSTATTTKTASAKTVTIQGHTIPKGDILLNVGDTVQWTNKDNFIGQSYDAHTIASGTIDPTGKKGIPGVVSGTGNGVPDDLFEEALQLNDSFSYTFDEPGEYPFYIVEHPAVSGEGKIIVR